MKYVLLYSMIRIEILILTRPTVFFFFFFLKADTILGSLKFYSVVIFYFIVFRVYRRCRAIMGYFIKRTIIFENIFFRYSSHTR